MIRSSSAASASDVAAPATGAVPQAPDARRASSKLPAPGRTGLRIRPRPMTWLQWTIDIAFAVAFEAILGWPYIIRTDFSLDFSWPLVPAVLLFTVALAVRRCLPGPALVLGLLALALQIALGQPPHGCDLALLVLVFSAAAYGSRTSQTAAAITAVAAPAAIMTYVGLVPQDAAIWSVLGPAMAEGAHISVILAAVIWFVLAVFASLFWAGGILRRLQLRSRDAQHERELAELESQRSREQLIVEQERNRIARDMHDVVAHSLAVVVAQADGARYMVRGNPEAAEPALQTIAEIAREALVDVRGLLAQLRHSQGEGPQAGLDDVATVLERMAGAGLRVEHRLAGVRRPIGQSAELAVYRLVQEALTNALRHGDPSLPTRLTVVWGEQELEVVIENRVSPVPPPPREGSGHGLIGMRERLGSIGGSVEAGRDGEVFRVRAIVPLQHTAAGAPAEPLEASTNPIPIMGRRPGTRDGAAIERSTQP